MTQEMPLEGLRVLDLAKVIAGPLSSALLADFGADVVKVELPNGNDGMRALPPFKDGVSLWGKVTNRNKRGVTLDIRKPEGLALLKRMLMRIRTMRRARISCRVRTASSAKFGCRVLCQSRGMRRCPFAAPARPWDSIRMKSTGCCLA